MTSWEFPRQWRALRALCVFTLAAASITASAASPNEAKPRKSRTTHPRPTLTHAPAARAPGLPFDRVVRPGLERQLARAHRRLFLSTLVTCLAWSWLVAVACAAGWFVARPENR